MKRFACALLLALLPSGTALGQERYFDSAGVRIRYIDQGTGPAVMLVHGFTATIETSWIDTGVLPDLAHDHRVIASGSSARMSWATRSAPSSSRSCSPRIRSAS